MKTQRLRQLLALSLGGALAGCGGADSGAPQNSTITFNPPGIKWHNPYPAADCYSSDPALTQVVITNDRGVPLNDIEVTITAGGGMWLYNDTDNNGAPSAAELSAPVAELRTKTYSSGGKYFFLTVGLGGTACTNDTKKGLEYETHVAVFSGGNYNNAIHTITSAAPAAP